MTHAISNPQGLSFAADASFAFVQALAAELSNGKVELLGFPEVAARVQRVLADPEVTADRVARVVGAEPVLASQLLMLANSVALNPSGKQISDLNAAIARVGLDTVRTATIAFAVRQLRGAAELRPIAADLQGLWKRSVYIASLCCVLSRETSVSPGTALLTGTLHGVGRLYIMTRALRFPTLFSNPAVYQAIERDWHLSIATALLENWSVPTEIVHAVRDCEDFARQPRGAPGLTELLVAATLLAVHSGRPDLLEARLQSVRAVSTLGLTRELCENLIEESANEIEALRIALT